MIKVRTQRRQIEHAQPFGSGAGVDRLNLLNRLRFPVHGDYSLAGMFGVGARFIGHPAHGRQADNTGGPAGTRTGITRQVIRRGPARIGAISALVGLIAFLPGCARESLFPGGSNHEVLNHLTSHHSRPGDSAGSIRSGDKSDGQDESTTVNAADPGARALVNAMIEGIALQAEGQPGPMVSLRPLRNQSRSSADEIDSLRGRLLRLLQAASAERKIRFTDRLMDEIEYTLGGTVYLIEREGVEQFEIYFALRPAGAHWTIWRNDDPVRLLRSRDAGRDFVFYSGERSEN